MEMVDTGCRGEQMERTKGGDPDTRACARARVGTYTHIHMHTYTRTHTQTQSHTSAANYRCILIDMNDETHTQRWGNTSTKQAVAMCHRHGRCLIRACLASGDMIGPGGISVASSCIKRSEDG